MKNILISM